MYTDLLHHNFVLAELRGGVRLLYMEVIADDIIE